MKEEVEREGAKVDEGGEETPVLVLDKYGAEAVKELKGRDDMALYQQRRCDRRSGPPARAHGHFVKPLLEGELSDCPSSLTAASSEEVVHIHDGRDRGENTKIALVQCLVSPSKCSKKASLMNESMMGITEKLGLGFEVSGLVIR